MWSFVPVFIVHDLSALLLRYNTIVHIFIALKVPSITGWLKEVLADSDVVAADPTLIGTTTWQSNEKELGTHLIKVYLFP